MPLTNLHPDYYDFFPNFTSEELSRRLGSLPFHQATLLGLKNVTRALTTPSRSAVAAFLRSSAADQRRLLADMLEFTGISHAVAAAAMKVWRDGFIPKQYHRYCYLNHFTPYSEHSCVSAPGMVALMIDQLRPEPSDRILEIGIGSGLHAAWISELLGNHTEIVGLERNEAYANLGRDAIRRAGYRNIDVRIGDALDTSLDLGAFSKVYVTAASFAPPLPALLKRINNGGIVQYVRGLKPGEFANEDQGSWLRRTFSSYAQYCSTDWSSYCCIVVAIKDGDELVEFANLYDVTFVPFSEGIITDARMSDSPFEELEHYLDEDLSAQPTSRLTQRQPKS